MPRIDEVPSRDAAPIAPAGLGAEMEGVGQSIGRDLPGGGDTGTTPAVTIEAEEPLEEGVDDSPLRLTGDQRGIERFRFGTVDKDEIGTLMTRPTPCKKENRDEGARPCRDNAPPHDRVGEWVTGNPLENSTRLCTVVSAMLRRA